MTAPIKNIGEALRRITAVTAAAGNPGKNAVQLTNIITSLSETVNALSAKLQELYKAIPPSADGFSENLSAKVFALIKTESDTSVLQDELSVLINNAKLNAPAKLTKDYTDESSKQQVKILSSNWFQYFIRTNPDDFLSRVHCPVLAINGEKDFQVLPDLNLSGIKKSLENEEIKLKNNFLVKGIIQFV